MKRVLLRPDLPLAMSAQARLPDHHAPSDGPNMIPLDAVAGLVHSL